MLFKVKPWDFANKEKEILNFTKCGIKSFFIEDPYIENIIKSKLPKKDLNFRVFIGSEVTQALLENQFQNLSLFSEPQNLLILSAELIGVEELNLLVNNFYESAKTTESHIVLFFSKLGKERSEILKKSEVHNWELESPRNWDGQKTLSFLMKEFKISLAPDIQRFILENIENETAAFIEVLKVIELNFPNGLTNIEELKKIITRDRYDFFDLIEIYHREKRKFLVTISKKSQDFLWFREFASSMENHLVKILFPEEILKKEKLNQYEQKIIRWSETCNRIELKYDLKFFADLELMAKSKNELLKDKIRREILK